jgi:8-oxo-dGTP pyrophosphatase MutT (NUDIX family)
VAEQLFQVGIKALVQNSQGQILLLGLSKWKGLPAYWDLPGGRMDPGETFLGTLKRELQEEIGCDLDLTEENTELITAVLSNITIPVGKKQVPLILIPFKVQLPDNATITLDPNSGEEDYAWCSPAEAAKRLNRKYPVSFCNQIKEL